MSRFSAMARCTRSSVRKMLSFCIFTRPDTWTRASIDLAWLFDASFFSLRMSAVELLFVMEREVCTASARSISWAGSKGRDSR